MNAPDWSAAIGAAEAAIAAWDGTGPGGAIVIFDASGARHSLAAGCADLATGAPFTAETVSRLASVTKNVFASFVLSRPDLIGLDDTLGHHLPHLPPGIGAIPVGRALDMSGGVPDTREVLTALGHSVYTRTEAPALLDLYAGLDHPSYAPGTEVHYSNGGYRLVEEALRARGALFADFVHTTLRDGAGLAFSARDYWIEPVPGLAPGYWHDGAGWQAGFQGMHLSAAGSLAGSARTLADWGAMLLADRAPVPGLLEKLSAPRHLAFGTRTGYGLGLRHQRAGAHELIGHGGSQPGYKSFLLLSPTTGSGIAIVANRDDADTAGIAASVMAAALGAALPAPANALPPGLYVAPEGADWLEIGATTARRLDDEVTLFDGGEGWSDSFSATSRLRLRWTGDAIEGWAGHAPVRYLPVPRDLPRPAHLDGTWDAEPFGARLEIRDGAVIRGTAPLRQRMVLEPLGNGRYLFTQRDGTSARRICLCETGAGRFELSLSRARRLLFHRTA